MRRRAAVSSDSPQMPNIDVKDSLKQFLAYNLSQWHIALDTRNGSYFKKMWRAEFGPTSLMGRALRKFTGIDNSLLFDPQTGEGWNTYDKNPGNPWRQTKNWFKGVVRPYRKNNVLSGFFKELLSPLRRMLWLGWNIVERALILAVGALCLGLAAAVLGIVLAIAAVVWVGALLLLPVGMLVSLFSLLVRPFSSDKADSILETGLDWMGMSGMVWLVSAAVALIGGLIFAIASPFIAVAMALSLINFAATEAAWVTLTLGALAVSPLTSVKSLVRLCVVTPIRQTESLAEDPKLLEMIEDGKAAASRLNGKRGSYDDMCDALYAAKRVHKRVVEIEEFGNSDYVTTKDSNFASAESHVWGTVSEDHEGNLSSRGSNDICTAALRAGKVGLGKDADTSFDADYAAAQFRSPLMSYFSSVASPAA